MGGWSRLEPVLRRHLPYLDDGDAIEPDASLTELGLDSMGTMELLEELEERFGVAFPEEALTIATFATPRSIWCALGPLLADVGLAGVGLAGVGLAGAGLAGVGLAGELPSADDRSPELVAHDGHAPG